MTRRRAIFLAVLTALVVVVAFAVNRFGRIAPFEVDVSVSDEPAPKPKTVPVTVSLMRVPLENSPDEDAEPADETPAGRLVAAAQAGDAARVGERRPPAEPPGFSRRCQSTGWTGAQPPDLRTSALPAERRTAAVADRLPRAAQQAASGPAEALRLPNVEERANEVEGGDVAPSAAGGHYGAAAGT